MRRFIPLIFVAAVLFVIVYSFFLAQPKTITLEYEVEEKICEEGETRSCTVDACAGLSKCVHGRWGVCKLDIVCVPGDRIPCVEGGPCACGYRECNDCGTAYGPCTGNESCG